MYVVYVCVLGDLADRVEAESQSGPTHGARHGLTQSERDGSTGSRDQ